MSEDNAPFPANLEARWQELRRARARLLEAVEAFRAAADATSSRPDRWSAAEIVYHLHRVEKSSVRALQKALATGARHEPASDDRLRAEWERIRRLVAVTGDKAKAPVFVAPDAAPELDATLELLKQSRLSLAEMVDGATYDQLLSISVPHPFETVGLLAGASWLSLIAAHEERHTRQIEAFI